MARVKKELTQEEQKLFNELKKLSKRANQRIVRLEREFGKDTWAVKTLKEKLEAEPLQAWTKSGRIKANSKMTLIQMKATIKATKSFLNNKTSTKKGIKEAKKKAIQTLKIRFSTVVNDITYKEAEALTSFFEDEEVNRITNFIPGSDVLAIIEESREKNTNYETFASYLESIKQWNGESNMENIMRKIYMKYVFRGNQNRDNIEVLYENVIDSINNANSESELDELESIINNLVSEGKINEKEYNYLINEINNKRKGI